MRPNRSASQPTRWTAHTCRRRGTLMTSPTMFRVAPRAACARGHHHHRHHHGVAECDRRQSAKRRGAGLLTARIARAARRCGSLQPGRSRAVAWPRAGGRPQPDHQDQGRRRERGNGEQDRSASGGRPTARQGHARPGEVGTRARHDCGRPNDRR
jgi:hypothetical protein